MDNLLKLGDNIPFSKISMIIDCLQEWVKIFISSQFADGSDLNTLTKLTEREKHWEYLCNIFSKLDTKSINYVIFEQEYLLEIITQAIDFDSFNETPRIWHYASISFGYCIESCDRQLFQLCTVTLNDLIGNLERIISGILLKTVPHNDSSIIIGTLFDTIIKVLKLEGNFTSLFIQNTFVIFLERCKVTNHNKFIDFFTSYLDLLTVKNNKILNIFSAAANSLTIVHSLGNPLLSTVKTISDFNYHSNFLRLLLIKYFLPIDYSILSIITSRSTNTEITQKCEYYKNNFVTSELTNVNNNVKNQRVIICKLISRLISIFNNECTQPTTTVVDIDSIQNLLLCIPFLLLSHHKELQSVSHKLLHSLCLYLTQLTPVEIVNTLINTPQRDQTTSPPSSTNLLQSLTESHSLPSQETLIQLLKYSTNSNYLSTLLQGFIPIIEYINAQITSTGLEKNRDDIIDLYLPLRTHILALLKIMDRNLVSTIMTTGTYITNNNIVIKPQLIELLKGSFWTNNRNNNPTYDIPILNSSSSMSSVRNSSNNYQTERRGGFSTISKNSLSACTTATATTSSNNNMNKSNVVIDLTEAEYSQLSKSSVFSAIQELSLPTNKSNDRSYTDSKHHHKLQEYQYQHENTKNGSSSISSDDASWLTDNIDTTGYIYHTRTTTSNTDTGSTGMHRVGKKPLPQHQKGGVEPEGGPEQTSKSYLWPKSSSVTDTSADSSGDIASYPLSTNDSYNHSSCGSGEHSYRKLHTLSASDGYASNVYSTDTTLDTSPRQQQPGNTNSAPPFQQPLTKSSTSNIIPSISDNLLPTSKSQSNQSSDWLTVAAKAYKDTNSGNPKKDFGSINKPNSGLRTMLTKQRKGDGGSLKSLNSFQDLRSSGSMTGNTYPNSGTGNSSYPYANKNYPLSRIYDNDYGNSNNDYSDEAPPESSRRFMSGSDYSSSSYYGCSYADPAALDDEVDDYCSTNTTSYDQNKQGVAYGSNSSRNRTINNRPTTNSTVDTSNSNSGSMALIKLLGLSECSSLPKNDSSSSKRLTAGTGTGDVPASKKRTQPDEEEEEEEGEFSSPPLRAVSNTLLQESQNEVSLDPLLKSVLEIHLFPSEAPTPSSFSASSSSLSAASDNTGPALDLTEGAASHSAGAPSRISSGTFTATNSTKEGTSLVPGTVTQAGFEESAKLTTVPTRFIEEVQYIASFRPLLVAEVKTAILTTVAALCNGQGNHMKGSGGYGRVGAPSTSTSATSRSLEYIDIRCAFLHDRFTTSGDSPQSSGGGGDGGGGASISECLQEARVAPVKPEGGGMFPLGRARPLELLRDDLVVLMDSSKASNIRDFKGLASVSPDSISLAIVLSSLRGNESQSQSLLSSSDLSSSSSFSQQTLLVLKGSTPPTTETWRCIPLMSLSTFLREWTAVHSVKSLALMPLAPYILKAAPVVSASFLNNLHDNLLENLYQLSTSIRSLQSKQKKKQGSAATAATAATLAVDKERKEHLERVVLSGLRQLIRVQIDGSVLKRVGVGRTIKKIARSKFLSQEIRSVGVDLMSAWKSQVKSDNKASTIKSMKGGNVVDAPSDVLECPLSIPPPLWAVLRSTYNRSQLFAIKYVSGCSPLSAQLQDTRISLIQGPPGTGKTSTILGMIAALLHRTDLLSDAATADSDSVPASVPESVDGKAKGGTTTSTTSTSQQQHKRILLCAPSNAAVDELLGRLKEGVLDDRGRKREVRLIRLGRPLEGCSQEIEKMTLDYLTEEKLRGESIWRQLQDVNEKIASIHILLNNPGGAGDVKHMKNIPNSISGDSSQLRKSLLEMRRLKTVTEITVEKVRCDIRRQLLQQAEVVACTLSSSGQQQLVDQIMKYEVRFEVTIIDEAAQTTEPSTLIPLRYGCVRLVLVGDPRQLPATVLCQEAEAAGLGVSLFERLERAGHEVVTLTVQHRMHPEIRRFPSDHFYQGRLQDAPHILAEIEQYQQTGEYSDRCNILLDFQQLKYLQPVVYFNTGGNSIVSSSSTSTSVVMSNHEERIGKSYQNRQEVKFALSLLKKYESSLHPYSIAIITPYKAQVRLFKEQIKALFTTDFQRSIDVNTVDGFQGREKDVVLFSSVRTTPNIQFLSDERRMNVAITRAKRCMVILGSMNILVGCADWKAMLESLEQRGFIRNCPCSYDFNDMRDLSEVERVDIHRSLQQQSHHQRQRQSRGDRVTVGVTRTRTGPPKDLREVDCSSTTRTDNSNAVAASLPAQVPNSLSHTPSTDVSIITAASVPDVSASSPSSAVSTTSLLTSATTRRMLPPSSKSYNNNTNNSKCTGSTQPHYAGDYASYSTSTATASTGTSEPAYQGDIPMAKNNSNSNIVLKKSDTFCAITVSTGVTGSYNAGENNGSNSRNNNPISSMSGSITAKNKSLYTTDASSQPLSALLSILGVTPDKQGRSSSNASDGSIDNDTSFSGKKRPLGSTYSLTSPVANGNRNSISKNPSTKLVLFTSSTKTGSENVQASVNQSNLSGGNTSVKGEYKIKKKLKSNLLDPTI